MRNFKTLLSLILSCQFLAACSDISQLHTKDVTGPVGNTQAENLGTGDGGGGNAINYKMLESHLIDPNKLAIVQTRVAPLLKKIFTDSAKGKKQDIFALKNWYLAPITLKNLPKEVLGVDFTSDRLQQVAIQTDKAIWIDSNYFNKMDDTEKARLIMHELLMNIYTMRFLSFMELCEVTARIGMGCDNISLENLERLNVEETYKPEVKRRLVDADYEAIRAMTAWVFANEETLSEESYETYALRVGFADKRFNKKSSSNEKESSGFIESTLEKVLLALNKAKLSGMLFDSCTSLSLKKSFMCELVWSQSEVSHEEMPHLKFRKLTVILKDAVSKEIIQQGSIRLMLDQKITLTKTQSYYILSMLSADFFSTQEIGFQQSMITMAFDMDHKGHLTLKGLLTIPFVYVGSETSQKTVLENGQEVKKICEARSFSRLHPKDLTTDSLMLMTHDGLASQVSVLNLVNMPPVDNCKDVQKPAGN